MIFQLDQTLIPTKKINPKIPNNTEKKLFRVETNLFVNIIRLVIIN